MTAPMLRPRQIIKGLQQIGYHVDVIEGTAEERKAKIKIIKQNIVSGIHYDFMYAESSSMPTLLTDSHHLPLHPCMDFSFFHFAKKNHIKIGLFYRDIYWKFDEYKKAVPVWKRVPAIICYHYDLLIYKKLLYKLYLPSYSVYKYLSSLNIEERTDELPSGCESLKIEMQEKPLDFSNRNLNIFYVGGLGNQYQIEELLKAVLMVPKCDLTICCRKNEWEKEKKHLCQYQSSRIHIIHKSSNELEELYAKADICSLLFKPDMYREMAMPYKAFEYLAHLKPVLVSQNTAIGNFVALNNIGWSIEYKASEITAVLNKIIDCPQLLIDKQLACVQARAENTWTKRALKIAEDLT